MPVIEPPREGSILAIAAHPDDIESWCAGTLVLSIDAGVIVRLLLVTSGDKGTSTPHATARRVAARREREASRAAQRLGIHGMEFLRYPDGEVEATLALKRDLVHWIRYWRPTTIFTHNPEHPWPPYLSHPDHRAVGRATLDAVYPLARDPLTFPEHRGLRPAPHTVRAVWLFAGTDADAYVDISASLDRKIAARLLHESQTPDPVALVASWRARAEAIGRAAGLAAAEAFTVLDPV